MKKLRLAGIANYDQANAYLDEHYLGEHNRHYARPAAEAADYHRRTAHGAGLTKLGVNRSAFAVMVPRRRISLVAEPLILFGSLQEFRREVSHPNRLLLGIGLTLAFLAFAGSSTM